MPSLDRTSRMQEKHLPPLIRRFRLGFLMVTTGSLPVRNTQTQSRAVGLALAICTFVVTDFGGSSTESSPSTAVPHFAEVTTNPARSISLSLAGVVPKSLAPYYDIYPL